jgi:hypothetical protein
LRAKYIGTGDIGILAESCVAPTALVPGGRERAGDAAASAKANSTGSATAAGPALRNRRYNFSCNARGAKIEAHSLKAVPRKLN